MPESRRGPSENRNAEVWLLGNSHPAADRSIDWHDRLPNLGDPDVLILDMTTLTKEVLHGIDSREIEQAQRAIRDKLLAGNVTVIVITQPAFSDPPAYRGLVRLISPKGGVLSDLGAHSSYRLLPVLLSTESVRTGKRIIVDDGHDFKAYLDAVTHYGFYISEYAERIDGHGLPLHFEREDGQNVEDNSGHDLGFVLTFGATDGGGSTRPKSRGRLVFLPPPTEPSGAAIEKILSVYGKASPGGEAPPAWSNALSLPQAEQLQEKISRLEGHVTEVLEEVDELKRQKGEILSHRRLLHSRGPDLEDAVVQAFRVLGFDDIMPMGGADEEDAAFDMGGITLYSYGVVEAKGADRGTLMQHILQCKKWANQRAVTDGKLSKGIFVPNQHRLQPYPKSLKARIKIEPNQLEQAEMNDICIIPTCVLFEAVKRVLGGEAPDRAKIAAKIAASKGVLKDVL